MLAHLLAWLRGLFRRPKRRRAPPRRRAVEWLESRRDPATAWQNPFFSLDVDGDALAAPSDALVIINDINRHEGRMLPPLAAGETPLFRFDVDGDDYISPTDALLIINHLGRQGAYEAAVQTIDGNVEYQLRRQGFHFGTLLVTPQGAVVVRWHPDPGDVNGWGTSLYANPFFAGADQRDGAVRAVKVFASRIEVVATGEIAQGAAASAGQWTWTATLDYDPAQQVVAGTAGLALDLASSIATVGADLNLWRIRSNRLDNVPLQGGGNGDTGDMADAAHVLFAAAGSGLDFDWNPIAQPGHFPTTASNFLAVELPGEVNRVDALGLGYPAQIAVARKPSLSLTTEAVNGILTFGGAFDVGKNQDPFADNVGVVGLVRQGSTPLTQLAFTMAFRSTPPA